MASPVATKREQEQERRLRRMKHAATGLLVVMAVVFLIAHINIDKWAWLAYLRAFSEAAMVGALADWFAVTALFRHPLGIPIPHTAIIPRQKDRLGETLARFMRENFLTPSALRPRLDNTDFAGAIGVWLAVPRNAEKVAEDLAGVLRWLLGNLDSGSLSEMVRRNLQRTLGKVTVTPVLGRVLDLLVSADHHQQLMDAAIAAARQALEENRFAIRLKIKTQSPWWVPKFVDEEIYDKIVTEIEGLLERMGSDENHAARVRFNESARELIESLKTDPELIERGEQLKNELLNHPAVQEYLTNVWSQVADYLQAQAEDPDSSMLQRLSRTIAGLGRTLRDDERLAGEINRWIRDATLYLVGQYRAEISSVISETVKAWDPAATSRRVELNVGRDLQFIRINGTLVGGFAGLAIYTLARFI